MHVNRRLDAVVLERLANHRADGQVGHVVVIHDVEVDGVGAGLEHISNLLAQVGKVGRQDRRRDEVLLSEGSHVGTRDARSDGLASGRGRHEALRECGDEVEHGAAESVERSESESPAKIFEVRGR